MPEKERSHGGFWPVLRNSTSEASKNQSRKKNRFAKRLSRTGLCVDHEVGRLLDALDQSRFADNTAIVLWSDHGWHLGEKQHWGKWTGWERSTRVPLIIVPPKNRSADFAAGGSRCDQPVGLIDLYPTLAEICGVEAPEGLDGESLVPLLREPAKKTGRIIPTLFDRGNVSLRDERFRYVRYADGLEEL